MAYRSLNEGARRLGAGLLALTCGCYSGLGEEQGTEGTGGTTGSEGPGSGPGSGPSGGTSADGSGSGGSVGSGGSSGDPSGGGSTSDAGSGGSSDGGPPPDEVELMCERWTSDRADTSEGTWSGSVASCDPGDVSAAGRANALRVLNLYRSMVGLPEVVDDPGRNTMAQACALMMHANGALSHSPPMTWSCYSADGATAAGSSNISTGPGVMSIDLYMVDPGNATTLGHRRWILSNSTGPVGLGSTSEYSCLWVLGGAGGGTNVWTAWPPPGPFPIEAVDPLGFSSLDQTGWSIQSDSIDLSGASVTITADGQDRPVSVTVLASGYGSDSAISMIPSGWTAQPGTTYHVRVDGIGQLIEYDVQVVDCG